MPFDWDEGSSDRRRTLGRHRQFVPRRQYRFGRRSVENQEKQTSTTSTPRPARKANSRGRMSRRLVIASSAAVLAVYAVGFARTQSAADQISAAASLVKSSPASQAPAPAQPSVASVAQAPMANPSPRFPRVNTNESDGSSATTPSDDPTAGADDDDSAVATATVEPTPSQPPAATVATTSAPTRVPPTPPPAPTAVPTTAPTAVATGYRDGTYSGTGVSRHGDISVQVVVKGGKIVSDQIVQSSTRYPVSRIASLPGEVLAAQSTNVDMVSGATDSSMAYLGAVANALRQAS